MTNAEKKTCKSKTTVEMASEWWCDSIIVFSNPDIDVKECPWGKNLISKSVEKGFVLSDSAIKEFKIELENVISKKLETDEKVILKTEAGPVGELFDVAQKCNVPDDLFYKDVEMVINNENVTVTQNDKTVTLK